MSIALIAFAALAQTAAVQPATPGVVSPVTGIVSAVTGAYVERAAYGSPDCANPDANRLDLHVLDGPPHDRSSNVGTISYRIGEVTDGFTLNARPVPRAPDRDGRRAVGFSGGRIHTAGRHVDGVSSGLLNGRFEGTAWLTADGDLVIRELRYGKRGASTQLHAADGRLPGSRALRAFSPCPAPG